MANQNLSNRLAIGVTNTVVPGTSAGLVPAAGLPGNTSGSAIAAGYVGQVIQSVVNTAQLTTSVANVTSVSLTAGVWQVKGQVNCRSSPSTRTIVYGTVVTAGPTSSGTNGTTGIYSPCVSDGVSTSYGEATIMDQFFYLTSTTTVYLNGYANIASTGANDCEILIAVRIA